MTPRLRRALWAYQRKGYQLEPDAYEDWVLGGQGRNGPIPGLTAASGLVAQMAPTPG